MAILISSPTISTAIFRTRRPSSNNWPLSSPGTTASTSAPDKLPQKQKPAEYVSGNFFSTFGLPAFAGRTLSFRLTTNPAPLRSRSQLSGLANQTTRGDPSVVGSTFYIQNQPFTIVGISPPGFFGDRIDSNPPALWIPLNVEPIIEGETSILKQPDTNWLYVLGRIKPGIAPGSLQAKISNTLRQWLSTQPAYTLNGATNEIPKQHVVITPQALECKTCNRKRAAAFTC